MIIYHIYKQEIFEIMKLQVDLVCDGKGLLNGLQINLIFMKQPYFQELI